MSLSKFIKNATKSQYIRALIVRAIEYACILLMFGVGIWAVCAVAGAALKWLGVG